MERYIIVTGIPASGKSTLARAIAGELKTPLLDKDEILEDLFDNRGVGNAEWRRQLSREADETLKQRTIQTTGAVVTSWWRHPASKIDTGTPTNWLASLPGALVEIHCICSPETAAERFLSRKRHEGHLDHLKTPKEILSDFRRHAVLGPLGIGRLISIDTEGDIDLINLAARIEHAFNYRDGES